MLSVILPARNEEKNIGLLLEETLSFLQDLQAGFEILIIDDGSEDRTRELALSYRQKHPNIHVISHARNLGYGAALCSGFSQTREDLVFFMDSDRQFDIRNLEPFLKEIPHYDFIIGYRKERKDSLVRLLNAFLFRQAARLFFGIRVKDVNCAFKLFHSRVIQSLSLSSSGALINLEIMALAQKGGYKFLELPVSHFPRKAGKQTGGNLVVVLKAMLNIFSLWWKLKQGS